MINNEDNNYSNNENNISMNENTAVDNNNNEDLNESNNNNNSSQLKVINSKYSDYFYINLLSEGQMPKLISFSSSNSSNQIEKEIMNYISNIISNLSKSDDWEMRIKALVDLQSLVISIIGDIYKIDLFINIIRENIDIFTSQILDLRSSVCKEACRTVAIISKCCSISTSFYILVDIFVPIILRLVSVKTQVMATAADRSIRIIITSTSIGIYIYNINIFIYIIITSTYMGILMYICMYIYK